MKLLSKRHPGRSTVTINGADIMAHNLVAARIGKAIEAAMLAGKFPPAAKRTIDKPTPKLPTILEMPMVKFHLKPLTEQQKVDFVNGVFTYEFPFEGHAIHTGEAE